jgi:RNA polymerase sigma factor (sigma-70 family)
LQAVKSVTISGFVKLLLSGDPTPVRLLQRRIAGLVSVYRGLDPADGEDIAAEVAAALIENLRKERFRGDSMAAFHAYLLSMVRNTVLAWRRKHRPVTADQNTIEAYDGGKPRSDRIVADRDAVAKILAQLSDDCASLLTMRFQQGLSNTEIALRLKIRSGAVRTRISRCIDKAQNLPIVREMLQ